jgi:uncharacterized phage protein (TIGR02220 family)
MSNVYHLNAVRAAVEPAPEQIEAQEGGYIKLFRSLQDSAFAGRPEYLSAWVHILMLASYKPRKTMLGNKPVMLQAGQFISGRKALAARVGVTEKQMRGILDFFVSEGMISKDSNRSGTIFTVCNYSVFQSNEGQQGPTVSGQQKGQAKPSNDAALSESGANEKASAGPTKRATTQEHKNISIPNGIDLVGQDEPAPTAAATSNTVVASRPKKSRPDYTEQCEQVIAHLNQTAGKRFKNTATNHKFISARLKDGHTLDDLITVIDRKTAEWIDDGRMNQYLRPATLFNAEKFEGYLNAPAGLAVQPQQRPRSNGPDWDDLTWANDLGGL